MTDPVQPDTFRCGHVALCGRPNVGKSTLLNKLLGQKLSITSRKPHTTRWHILGIKSNQDYQLIFMDLPGLRRQHGNQMNRFMHREVAQGLLAVDSVVFILEAGRWLEEDVYVLEQLKSVNKPVYAVLNKTDRLADKGELLPFIKTLSTYYEFVDIIPISAKTGYQTAELEKLLADKMPVAPAIFPDDQISDRNERFFMAELLREQLMRFLGDELPYCSAVTIEHMGDRNKAEIVITDIHAVIWVETEGQKAIVIGQAGERMKKISTAARLSMEAFLEHKVNLKTWVKVRDKWTDDERSLGQFGYQH
ncbi:MAG: GTPase Era [Gammaproteobacteria bacterium]